MWNKYAKSFSESIAQANKLQVEAIDKQKKQETIDKQKKQKAIDKQKKQKAIENRKKFLQQQFQNNIWLSK